MTRLFALGLAALILSGCLTDPQTTSRAAQPGTSPDTGLVVLGGNASEAQLTRAAQSMQAQHGDYILAPLIVSDRGGDIVVHRNYLAACDRQQVDRVVGQIAADGQRHGRTLRGPASTAKNAHDTLSASRRAYQSAQSECGFDYRREIAQLEARENAAWNNYIAVQARPQSNFSIGDATALINGATSIINVLNPGGGGGGGVGNDPCVNNPSPHAVCR